MKHLCIGGALALILVLGAVIGTATEASAKVGIIDTQEVLRDSRAANVPFPGLVLEMNSRKGYTQRGR